MNDFMDGILIGELQRRLSVCVQTLNDIATDPSANLSAEWQLKIADAIVVAISPYPNTSR